MATTEFNENEVRKFLAALSSQDSQKQGEGAKYIKELSTQVKGVQMILKCNGTRVLLDTIKGPPKTTTNFKMSELYNFELSEEIQKNILHSIAAIIAFSNQFSLLTGEINEVLYYILLYFTHKKSKTTNAYVVNTNNSVYTEVFPLFVTCVDKIGLTFAEYLTNRGVVRILVTIFKSAYDLDSMAVTATVPLLLSLTNIDDFVKAEFYVYDSLAHVLNILSGSVRFYKKSEESKKSFTQILKLLATVSSYALSKIDLQFGNPEILLPLLALVNFGENEVQENAKKVIKNLGLKDFKLLGEVVMIVFDHPSSNIKSYKSDGNGCIVTHTPDLSLFQFEKSYLLAVIQ